MTSLDDIRDMGPCALAGMADCLGPDAFDSPGARLLERVRDGVVGAIECGSIAFDDFDDSDQLHEIADGAPSVYTHPKWRQFVDLGAYLEEPECGDWPTDLDRAASIALYQICERLARALCEQWRERWECPVCGADAESGCRPDACDNPAGPLVSLAIERLKDTADKGPEVPADPFAGHPDYVGPDWQKPYETLPKAPVAVVEPLPVRTPGETLTPVPDVLSDHRGPYPVAVTDAAGNRKLIFATGRDALAHGERMSRAVSPPHRGEPFNWAPWAGLGLMILSALGVLVAMKGGVL